MEKILEGLDRNIFTEAMVEEIKKVFQEAVDKKVKKIEKSLIKEKKQSLSILKSKHNAVLNKLADRNEKLAKLSERKLDRLEEQYALELKEQEKEAFRHFVKQKKDLQKHYSEMFESTVKEEVNKFIRKNGHLFEEALQVSREKLIQESIKATMKISGNDIEVMNNDEEIENLKEEIMILKRKNTRLEESVKDLAKENIFERVSSHMSLSEKDSFSTLCESVTFINEKQFEEKLQNLARKVKHKSSKPFTKENLLKEKEEGILRTVPNNENIYSRFLKQ